MDCDTIIDLGLWQAHRCCWTCHDEEHEYGYASEVNLDNGDTLYVCCALSAEGDWEAISRALSEKETVDQSLKS